MDLQFQETKKISLKYNSPIISVAILFYLGKHHNISSSTSTKANSNEQQEESYKNTPDRTIELFKGYDKATSAHARNPNCLNDSDNHLEEENKEEDHKVEA